MDHWWEIDLPDALAPALVRAVAYYRHSAQDRQENSIPIQQDQVRAWAKQHGVEIIREFCDAHYEAVPFVKRKRDRQRVDLVEDGIGDERIRQTSDVYRSPTGQKGRRDE